MADHPRKLIREAVKAALLGQTNAGDNVESRRIPVTDRRLQTSPVIGVYTRDEDVDPDSAETAPRELKRHPQLVVVLMRRADVDAIDDLLDEDAADIEVAMAADDTLGGTASDCWLRRTEFDFEDHGSQELACVRLFYAVTYFGYAPASEHQALDEFRQATVTYDLAHAQAPAEETHDVVKFDRETT